MMSGQEPLDKTIEDMAGAAAFADSRFSPLTADELSECRIEISVLSPLEECHDPSTVKVGTHGLYLAYHGQRGVLLPQVPIEENWNQKQFLEYVCMKAGVPPQSYLKQGAKLWTFTALVFGEQA
jgi:AmmeMemoRadiSam system protein A